MFHRNGISLIIEKLKSLSIDHWTIHVKPDLERIFNLDLTDIDNTVKRLKSVKYNDVDTLNAIYQLFEINPKQFLDNVKPYLTTNQVITLSLDPLITIGAHTTDHRELYLEKDKDRIKTQILQSINVVRRITKEEVIPFAFPFTSENMPMDILEEIKNEFYPNLSMFGEPNFSATKSPVIYRYGFDDCSYNAVDTIKNHYLESIKRLIGFQ